MIHMASHKSCAQFAWGWRQNGKKFSSTFCMMLLLRYSIKVFCHPNENLSKTYCTMTFRRPNLPVYGNQRLFNLLFCCVNDLLGWTETSASNVIELVKITIMIGELPICTLKSWMACKMKTRTPKIIKIQKKATKTSHLICCLLYLFDNFFRQCFK